MRRVLVVSLVLAAMAAGAMAGEPEAIEPEKTIVLFNGKNLDGWTIHVRGKTDPGKVFWVEDGLLKCAGRPPGYIRTNEAYKNYKFVMEWRFTRPGNSGVLVHMIGQDRVWPKSLECQGAYKNQGDFWVIGGFEHKEHKAGGKRVGGRRTRKLGPHNEKKIGEWNTYEIVCKGDTVVPYVNGKKMNEATECSWTAGRICIQSESAVWEARKIVLEPLDK
ncbi:MAG: 3-keto-disaccharide hydrolase [Planctomycetota bacterium]